MEVRMKSEERRFLVDVGMKDMPFPIKAASRIKPDGQSTIANISVHASIVHEFEARRIDKFIKTLHQHRERIGTSQLRANVMDYLKELDANTVRIDYEYPYFIEKTTPVSREKCLVLYNCTHSVKITSIGEAPKVIFAIEVPAITTDPASAPEKTGGLFGQLSTVKIEVESERDIFPEDIVDIVDKHALSPVYSFLAREDQLHIIEKVHAQSKSSVVLTDNIRTELSRNADITWYEVRCSNFGMLHSYSTVVGTENSMWVPFVGFENEDI